MGEFITRLLLSVDLQTSILRPVITIHVIRPPGYQQTRPLLAQPSCYFGKAGYASRLLKGRLLSDHLPAESAGGLQPRDMTMDTLSISLQSLYCIAG